MGLSERARSNRGIVLTGLIVFVGAPLYLYAVGDVPRRSALKETISVLTLVAFCLMLGQFYLARSNQAVVDRFDRRKLQRFHKVIAYSVVLLFLLHPLMVVLPRFFEAGVDPADALLIMLTTFDSPGIVLGEIGWAMMLLIGVTALFRRRLISRLHISYLGWRMFHGFLTVAFAAVAIWHAIALGRHVDTAMATYLIALAAGGSALLFRMYATAARQPTGA